MAPRLPSTPGDDGGGGITPPHLLDAEQQAAADDGVDMPPPLLPDPDSFPVLPPHPGWGTWHLEPEVDGEQDHDHHHADADAGEDDDPLGFGAEPADALVVLAEDGEGPVIVPEEAEDGEEGDEEEENVFIPHYEFSLLIQADEEQELDLEMPPLMDDCEEFDETPGANPIFITSLRDVHSIISYPQHARDYIVVSFKFGHTLDVLNGVRIARAEQDWQWVGNFRHLIQAARLAQTIAQLNRRLICLSSSFQDHCLETDAILSLSAFLPDLAAERINLQPAFIRYYADAIIAAIKFLSALVPAGPRLTCCEDLDAAAAVQYMLERISTLEEEEVKYRKDVLPHEPMQSSFGGNEDDREEEVNDDVLLQKQPVQSPLGGYEEEQEDEEEEEDENDCVYDLRLLLQAEDENDTEMPRRVSICDSTYSEDEDTTEQFVLIRGLCGLEHIRSAPQTYSRSSYYIIESFRFGDAWDLVHGIREISESQVWLWVGNLELLRQVHDLRDTFALLHHDLNKLLRNHRFDRESISSLECLTSELDFSKTIKQPPNVRYWIDNVAVALRALIGMLRDEVTVEPHARHTDFSDIDARMQAIIQRMDAIDEERVKYSRSVFPPEVLPPLPGYSPIPLRITDTSPVRSPENSPLCADRRRWRLGSI